MPRREYQLTLLNYVGGYDFDADYTRYKLSQHKDSTVNVLIDSRGGSLATALSISSAFADHGDVHVHYTGVNASAATIASLGAKHVSIAPDAFYLVHQASLPFFEFRNLNADQIEERIAAMEKAKADLVTYDRSISEAYARRCKKPAEELLALMKKECLLSAKEALEWGFVDEITSYDGDAPLRVTEELAAECSAIGLRLPDSLAPKGPLARFFHRIADIFTAREEDTQASRQEPQPSTITQTMNTENNHSGSSPAASPAQAAAESQAPGTDAIAALTARVAALESSQAKPAAESPMNSDDSPLQVIGDGASPKADGFAAAAKAGATLYASLP